MEKLRNFFESKSVKTIIVALFALATLLLVFWLGVAVGNKNASFSCRLGEYYHELEGHTGGILSGENPFENLPISHGSIGSIIKINLPEITIADKDGVEKTILVTDDTLLREFRQDIKISDLHIGDMVTVIGSPNKNGLIQASLVRILPPPPNTASSTAPSQSDTNSTFNNQ